MLIEHVAELSRDLQRLIPHDNTLRQLARAILDCFRAGGKVLTCGNGGSSAEAAHLAEEFTGRFYRERVSLPGICLSIDGTLLTCIGNDYGFDSIFARQVTSIGSPGDVLIGFTTSGNSENVIRALHAGREKGIITGLFSGKDGGRAVNIADFEIVVSSDNPSSMRVQECHQLLLHVLCEYVERDLLGISAIDS